MFPQLRTLRRASALALGLTLALASLALAAGTASGTGPSPSGRGAGRWSRYLPGRIPPSRPVDATGRGSRPPPSR